MQNTIDEKKSDNNEKDDLNIQHALASKEDIFYIEEEEDKKDKYDGEEDIDIQVVNELATVEDDTTLPCYTVRTFVTGIVSFFF
jgi:hypothetical protein